MFIIFLLYILQERKKSKQSTDLFHSSDSTFLFITFLFVNVLVTMNPDGDTQTLIQTSCDINFVDC